MANDRSPRPKLEGVPGGRRGRPFARLLPCTEPAKYTDVKGHRYSDNDSAKFRLRPDEGLHDVRSCASTET